MVLEYRNKDGHYMFELHHHWADQLLNYIMKHKGWRTVPGNRVQFIQQKTDGIWLGYDGVRLFECLFRYGDYINIKK